MIRTSRKVVAMAVAVAFVFAAISVALEDRSVATDFVTAASDASQLATGHLTTPEQRDLTPAATESGGTEEVDIDVNWWMDPPVDEYVVTEPYAMHVAELMALVAAGNANAAMSLYEIMRICSEAYIDRQELDEAIELAYQTHQFMKPGMEKPAKIGEPDRVETYVEVGLQIPFENCAGLTLEQRSQAHQWLEKAAALGNTIAMIELGTMAKDHDVAVSYLKQAWGKGNADALPFLATRLGQEYESGRNPDNRIRAYAAFYAYNILIQAGLSGHGDIAGRWVQKQTSTLHEIEATMHDYEVTAGREIAIGMIESNSMCCRRM